jgi:hypothetical protein
MRSDALQAAIGGTREMMREDEFAALVAALVDCNAIPRSTMADVLIGLSDKLIARARGELASDFCLYPAELFDRARSLNETAARLNARLQSHR